MTQLPTENKMWVARKHTKVLCSEPTSLAVVRWLKDHEVRGAIITVEETTVTERAEP